MNKFEQGKADYQDRSHIHLIGECNCEWIHAMSHWAQKAHSCTIEFVRFDELKFWKFCSIEEKLLCDYKTGKNKKNITLISSQEYNC